MPIYEYCCKNCNEVFAVFQSIGADEKDTFCNRCGSNDIKRNISSFNCYTSGGGCGSSSGSSGGFGGG